ncbi:DUF397 domain-containing protein [Streptomyces sp. B1866]|uniref:DUF397 domain-containing protein n=1 Tax=Streptomyces sp. B1866 TaxID=3075431 RepID=UPI00288D7D7A|nr:DUF397 domain-containing protein [Streptomyces sp. B1866]MDT3396951.1 DUF397 domain-containing protein [Streptomyces sp. B1866]
MTDLPWRQSSYCGNGGNNCVELAWVKSSFSDAGGNNCVELATDGDRVAIRESADPTQVITTRPTALRAFIRAAKAGEFDLR